MDHKSFWSCSALSYDKNESKVVFVLKIKTSLGNGIYVFFNINEITYIGKGWTNDNNGIYQRTNAHLNVKEKFKDINTGQFVTKVKGFGHPKDKAEERGTTDVCYYYVPNSLEPEIIYFMEPFLLSLFKTTINSPNNGGVTSTLSVNTRKIDFFKYFNGEDSFLYTASEKKDDPSLPYSIFQHQEFDKVSYYFKNYKKREKELKECDESKSEIIDWSENETGYSIEEILSDIEKQKNNKGGNKKNNSNNNSNNNKRKRSGTKDDISNQSVNDLMENSDLFNKYFNLTQENEILIKSNNTLTQIIGQYEHSIDENQVSINILKKKNDEQFGIIENWKFSYKLLEIEKRLGVEELETTVNDLKSQISSLQSDKKVLVSRIETYKTNSRKTSTELNKCNAKEDEFNKANAGKPFYKNEFLKQSPSLPQMKDQAIANNVETPTSCEQDLDKCVEASDKLSSRLQKYEKCPEYIVLLGNFIYF